MACPKESGMFRKKRLQILSVALGQGERKWVGEVWFLIGRIQHYVEGVTRGDKLLGRVSWIRQGSTKSHLPDWVAKGQTPLLPPAGQSIQVCHSSQVLAVSITAPEVTFHRSCRSLQMGTGQRQSQKCPGPYGTGPKTS